MVPSLDLPREYVSKISLQLSNDESPGSVEVSSSRDARVVRQVSGSRSEVTTAGGSEGTTYAPISKLNGFEVSC